MSISFRISLSLALLGLVACSTSDDSTLRSTPIAAAAAAAAEGEVDCLAVLWETHDACAAAAGLSLAETDGSTTDAEWGILDDCYRQGEAALWICCDDNPGAIACSPEDYGNGTSYDDADDDDADGYEDPFNDGSYGEPVDDEGTGYGEPADVPSCGDTGDADAGPSPAGDCDGQVDCGEPAYD
jgi:hypothetical protein